MAGALEAVERIRARVTREAHVYLVRERLADVHSNRTFAGLTWIAERNHVLAMTADDVRWLDAHWRLAETEAEI